MDGHIAFHISLAVIASRLEAIASRVEATASRLEALRFPVRVPGPRGPDTFVARDSALGRARALFPVASGGLDFPIATGWSWTHSSPKVSLKGFRR